MSSVLVTVDAILVVALTLVLLLVFAAIRRIREIEQYLVDRGQPLPELGTAVTPFEADLVGGGRVTSDDLQDGERWVAFLSNGCEPCEALSADLVAGRSTLDRPLLVIAEDEAKPGAREMAARLSAVGDVALARDGLPIRDAFGDISAFPTILRLVNGRIQTAGHRLHDVLAAVR